jgi:hypothetical protein
MAMRSTIKTGRRAADRLDDDHVVRRQRSPGRTGGNLCDAGLIEKKPSILDGTWHIPPVKAVP